MDGSALNNFCVQFRELLEKDPSTKQIIVEGQNLLRELLSKRDCLRATFTRIILDNDFLEKQRAMLDPNNIVLYSSNDRLFSVGAFIWEPDIRYPVHDHGAWGMVGVLVNPLEERRFKRIDDRKDSDYARLEIIKSNTLMPGNTIYVNPLDDGIHQMWNPGRHIVISIHIYGKPVRKGYINLYDLVTNKVSRVYYPQKMIKVMAIKALGSLSEPWATEVLKDELRTTDHEYYKLECTDALKHIEMISHK